ncbi:MAG: efflux RND transporter periplasmic adaptor subunit [Hyphomicrobiaceae bacterium]
MKTNAWVPLALAVVLAAGLFLAIKARTERTETVETAGVANTGSSTTPATDGTAVTQTPVSEWEAAAPGRVEPRLGEIRIGAGALGRVVAVLVEPADTVKTGDLLVQMDEEELEARARAAQAEVQARRKERDDVDARNKTANEIRKAEDRVADAEEAFWSAREAEDALAVLSSRGKAEASEIEAARTKLAEDQKALDDARAELARLKAADNAPLPTRLESALAAARAERAVNEALREKLRIRAPSDGTVLLVDVKTGQTVAPSAELPLITLGDLTGLRVKAEIEERDAAKVKVDQLVTVKSDAFPDREFEGKVISIAPSLTPPKLGARGFRQRSDVDVLEFTVEVAGDAPLVPGMRVDVFLLPDKV